MAWSTWSQSYSAGTPSWRHGCTLCPRHFGTYTNTPSLSCSTEYSPLVSCLSGRVALRWVNSDFLGGGVEILWCKGNYDYYTENDVQHLKAFKSEGKDLKCGIPKFFEYVSPVCLIFSMRKELNTDGNKIIETQIKWKKKMEQIKWKKKSI